MFAALKFILLILLISYHISPSELFKFKSKSSSKDKKNTSNECFPRFAMVPNCGCFERQLKEIQEQQRQQYKEELQPDKNANGKEDARLSDVVPTLIKPEIRICACNPDKNKCDCSNAPKDSSDNECLNESFDNDSVFTSDKTSIKEDVNNGRENESKEKPSKYPSVKPIDTKDIDCNIDPKEEIIIEIDLTDFYPQEQLAGGDAVMCPSCSKIDCEKTCRRRDKVNKQQEPKQTIDTNKKDCIDRKQSVDDSKSKGNKGKVILGKEICTECKNLCRITKCNPKKRVPQKARMKVSEKARVGNNCP